MRLCERLMIPQGITAVVGGGGKTTLLWRLATELREHSHVLLTTTTHMWPPPCMVLNDPTQAQIRQAFARDSLVAAGSLQADGKLAQASSLHGDFQGLAEHVLIEADGSRGLPLKAPAVHEPALPQGVALTLAVAGMDCAGHRIAEAAHRPAIYAALAGAGENEQITPEMVARVLTHPQGQAKGVSGRLAFVLNQADTSAKLAFARAVAALLPGDTWIVALIAEPAWAEHWRQGKPLPAEGV